MFEEIINVPPADVADIFGVNNAHIELLQRAFPHLAILARGNELKVKGSKEQIEDFSLIFNAMLSIFDKYGYISDNDLLHLLEKGDSYVLLHADNAQNDVILSGRDGKIIRARTPNQKRMVESLAKNDMIFAIGPAGTGKTYTAVALAVKALRNKEVKRIILTRPAVEAGENLGFLPGDLRDKLDPYLQPLYDALRDMLPPQKLLSFMEDKTIEIAPLAFMRGRTLDNACVILDEAQNATATQLKMFLTRMGNNAKFLITGDLTQIDLPKHQHSGLLQATKLLQNIEGIDIIFLNTEDIIRHKIVTQIVEAYKKENILEKNV
ncbi:MAG: PhoH family protein [Bacteroidales bacterium]|jgi:phosphate starvation-inducible PhoH-like protein|nr:PhoH family protein [Bacteroidales bacterium]